MDLRHLLRFWLWDTSQWMTFFGLVVALTGEFADKLGTDHPSLAQAMVYIGLAAAVFNRSLLRPPNP